MEPTEKAKTNDSAKGSETPFFARFLEGQHIETESGAVSDEASIMTLKYPSDRDEDTDQFSRP
jgi:Serine endopeptidase inhibitors